MACFYCGKRHISSDDAGTCEESCSKLVCIKSISSRPQDYHGDQCNCGCAKLVCIYEMHAHSRDQHKSAVEDCFPDSAADAGLAAGWAVEQSGDLKIDQPTPDQAEIRRAVFRFVTIERPPVGDVPLPFGTASGPNYHDLQFPGRAVQWPTIAAALVPHMMGSLIRSWPKVRNLDFKYGLGRQLNERLDALVAADASPTLLDKDPLRVLQAWFDFSPRLALVFVQHGRDGKLRDRVREASYKLQQHDLHRSIMSRMPWTAAPATLEAVNLHQGSAPLAH